MQRLLPPEMEKLHGWLLMQKEFDDANFIGDMIKAMKENKKISFGDSLRFRKLLKTFQTVLLLSGKL